jgi:lipoprotein NlpD
MYYGLRTWAVGVICLSVVACATSDNFAPVAEVSGYEAVPVSGAYRVTSHDTLYSIAWRYGCDYRVLARDNNINAPYAIHSGQMIYLKGPKSVASVITQPEPQTESQPELQPQTQASLPIKVRPVIRPIVKQEVAPIAPAIAPKLTPRQLREEAKEPSYQIASWSWPAHGKVLSIFSPKNKGIDIGGSLGSPIYAAAPGKIVYAGSGLRGYGNLIIIKHNSQTLSAYAYNSRLYVRDGEWVKKGQKIAAMGRGAVGLPTLHFEIRHAGLPVNPLNLLN